MFTIEEYINSLKADKENLVTYLTTKGITASSSETFTTLVPKVLDIETANLESKNVTITTNTTTTLTPVSPYNGFSSVEIVTNIVPTGTLNITSNGVYDVTNYASADVSVPQPTGTINITSNGTHDVTNYASANVNVSLDLSDYFGNTISAGSGNVGGYTNLIKKIPDGITVSGTSLQRAFIQYKGTSLPTMNTSAVVNIDYAFDTCLNVTAIPYYNFENVTSAMGAFEYCESITSFPITYFNSLINANSMFAGCILLKTFSSYYFPNLTNCFNMFRQCLALEDLPPLQVKNASNVNFSSMFALCPSLTDASINNIMQMCIDTTNYNGTKTLAYLGFESSDYPASRIQGLTNYTAFVNAGWTIGY